MSSVIKKPPCWNFDTSQWNIPIALITLECQINKYYLIYVLNYNCGPDSIKDALKREQKKNLSGNLERT